MVFRNKHRGEQFGLPVARTSVPSVRAARSPREELVYLIFEQEFLANPMDNLLYAIASFQVREHEGLRAPHQPRIAIHYSQIGANVWCQVRFVNDQQI